MTAVRPTRDVAATVERLAKIGYCNSARWSPDGGRIVFISDLAGTPQAWTIASQGGWPTKVTAFDDPVLWADWSSTGDRIAVTVAPGGGLNMQIHTLAPTGAGIRRLTAGGRENNFQGPWTWDGQHIFVTSNRRDPASLDTYLVDEGTIEWREVARTIGMSGITDVSRDGRRALLVRVRERGDSDMYVLDLATGAEIHMSPHTDRATFTNGRLSPDGRWAYLITDTDREFSAFVRRSVDAAGIGPIEVLAERDHDVDAFALSYDGTRAALVWNIAGRSELEIFDTMEGRPLFRPTLPVEIVGGLQWSRNGRGLAFTGAGAATTTDIYVLDAHVREIRRLTWSPHPGVDLETLPQPRIEHFKAHDGLALTGWLYLPRDRRMPGPVVLSFHGGPEGQERPGLNRTYHAMGSLSLFAAPHGELLVGRLPWTDPDDL